MSIFPFVFFSILVLWFLWIWILSAQTERGYERCADPNLLVTPKNLGEAFLEFWATLKIPRFVYFGLMSALGTWAAVIAPEKVAHPIFSPVWRSLAVGVYLVIPIAINRMAQANADQGIGKRFLSNSFQSFVWLVAIFWMTDFVSFRFEDWKSDFVICVILALSIAWLVGLYRGHTMDMHSEFTVRFRKARGLE